MKAQGYCHFNDDGNNRSFRINLFETDLDIEQDPGDRALGHGAVVWDAAVVLSKFMEKTYKDYDTKTLAKKTVLELGSGCGLGGIAFMMKGAEVTFTDLEPVTKRLTELNVQVVLHFLH
jgi:predicted nicotinamide N-methyase